MASGFGSISTSQIHLPRPVYGGTPPSSQSVFKMNRVSYRITRIGLDRRWANSYQDKERNWLAEDGLVQQLMHQPQRPDIVFVYVDEIRCWRELEKGHACSCVFYGLPEAWMTYARSLLEEAVGIACRLCYRMDCRVGLWRSR